MECWIRMKMKDWLTECIWMNEWNGLSIKSPLSANNLTNSNIRTAGQQDWRGKTEDWRGKPKMTHTHFQKCFCICLEVNRLYHIKMHTLFT